MYVLKDPAATSFVTNFTVIYLKIGFPRMDEKLKTELVPSLLAALEGKPPQHQDSMLLMMLPTMGELQMPDNEDKKKVYLGLRERPQAAKLLHDFLLSYLLLPYGSHPSLVAPPKPPSGPGRPQAAVPPPPPEEDSGPKTPAGMSERDWKRVAGETIVRAEELERNKVKVRSNSLRSACERQIPWTCLSQVVKFLGSGLLETMDVALPLVVAAADTRHSVASQADTEIRKLSGEMDWEDPTLIAKVLSKCTYVTCLIPLSACSYLRRYTRSFWEHSLPRTNRNRKQS